jgi:hypothetical protein
MTSVDAASLIALMRGPTLRVRTGVWLAPKEVINQAADHAARLGISCVDIRARLLAELPTDTRFTGLTPYRVVALLDGICDGSDGTDCILVENLDLLLARLRLQERQEVWDHLRRAHAHRRRALLIVMPGTAKHLLPSSEDLGAWKADGRLVE